MIIIEYALYPQSFGNVLNMTQSALGYGAFLVQLYAYCWFGTELTRLVCTNNICSTSVHLERRKINHS